jgi:hypothetical protein
LYRKKGFNATLIKPYEEINLYNMIIEILNLGKFHVKSEERLSLNKDNQWYDLSELKEITSDHTDYLCMMLETFIDNTIEDFKKMTDLEKQEKWKQIGDFAHKMSPSYRHLKVNEAVLILEEMETSITNPHYIEKISDKILMLGKINNKLINILKEELNNAKQS